MAQVKLPNHTFEYKADLLGFQQHIWNEYKAGRRGSVITDPREDLILRELTQYYHKEPELKIGCGIDHFEVRRNRDFPNNVCFYIVRTDGSETDISFKNPTHSEQVRRAMRNEIEEQVREFRKQSGFEGDSSVHVDHVRPLDRLIKDFLDDVSIPVKEVNVEGTKDGASKYYLEDRQLANDWRRYHNDNAKYQILPAKQNLSKGAR